MISFLINKLIRTDTSVRNKLLAVIIGVTVFGLVISHIIGLSASIISDYNRGYINAEHYKWEFVIALSTTGLGAIFAYFLACALEKQLTKPVSHLTSVAAQLANTHDYSIRAKKYADDEIGFLTDSFNAMINAAEEKQEALEQAKNEAFKANQQKSAFLAMMSHEIRTPINGIVGSTDLLSETQLTGRQKDHVHIIEKSAESLLSLINDILDFSKIEAEKLKIEKIPFDLTQHIQDVLDISQINAGHKGIRLFFTNKLDFYSYVLGDPTRVKQILINLVSNAIKFTHEGSITLTVSEKNHTDTPNTKFVNFSITDTGIGIPKESLDIIFESFSQANASTTRQYGGTGLGLAICKRLVEMMGGEIGVQSTEGIGSTFWFTLPFEITEKDESPSVPLCPAPIISGNSEVMLVEDNETNIMITSQILQNKGYETILCRNGAEAVAAYQHNHTPLILMDCQMPIMDGWEATQKIRAYEKENDLSPTYILALTANAMQGDREKCLAAGMDDYLPKPFKKHQLLDKLVEIAQQKDAK